MDPKLWLNLNAAAGSLVVTVGLWMLLGHIPLALAVGLALAMAGLVAWRCETIGAVWMATTCVLGLESFAWPIMKMRALSALGPTPPVEELQKIFTPVMFGLFSGVFWLTFAYGIYKRTRGEPPLPESTAEPTPPKKRKKGKRRR